MRLLPFEYAVRNLGRSPARLAMSLLGAALVVGLVMAASGFVRGMDRSLARSGSPNNVILLGAGSEESIERSEIGMSVSSEAVSAIAGVRTRAGVAFVSPEVHMAMMVALTPDGEVHGQAVVRGVKPGAFLVHPAVRMVEGRVFRPGEDEVIVGGLTATRLGVPEPRLAVGRALFIDGRRVQIVGRFHAPNTVMDAEIWYPLTNLQILTRRDSLSCVVLTLDDPGAFADAESFAVTRLDLELVATRESDYYGAMIRFYRPVQAMIWVTALLIALGGLFGGLNTLYAAFAARAREVGMLQSLGYSRLAVVVSFLQESVLASAAGTLVGAGLCLALLDGVAVRFTMGAFALLMDGPTVTLGVAAGLLLGLVGALPPTLLCLRLPIPEALKS